MALLIFNNSSHNTGKPKQLFWALFLVNIAFIQLRTINNANLSEVQGLTFITCLPVVFAWVLWMNTFLHATEISNKEQFCLKYHHYIKICQKHSVQILLVELFKWVLQISSRYWLLVCYLTGLLSPKQIKSLAISSVALW